ncbi:MAG: S41 family peptidase [Limnochordales bacterium]|nr:S41 family peptidase [Limnochordales bacterium]
MRSRRRLYLLAGVVLVLLISSGIGLFLLPKGVTGAGQNLTELAKVYEIVMLVKNYYVDKVSATDLLKAYSDKGSIEGMLATLGDPYTRYLDPQAWEQVQIDTTGTFAGLGLYVGMSEEGAVTVTAPIPGTPAEKAGILPGDRVLKIDGRSTEGMSLDEAVSLMRGPEGTQVRLELAREGVPEPIVVTITRETIHVPSVTGTSMLPGGVGYVRLLQFSQSTASELDTALARLISEGMKALILDLRFNPGGLLDVSVAVASRFIAEGPIVWVVSRGERSQVYTAWGRSALIANGGTPLYTEPMAVLVNGYSASASEIVSGALQDAGRAKLVGTKTFGKGLVQTLIPLRSGGALSLTTSRYLTRGKRTIEKEGIRPDIEVADPPLEDMASYLSADKPDLKDPQLRAAHEYLVRQLAAQQTPPGHGAGGAIRAAAEQRETAA